MTERELWITQELFRKVAHDIVGCAGITRGALREIELSLGQAPTEQQAALFAMTKRGVVKLERLARRLRLAGMAEGSNPSSAASLEHRDLREVIDGAIAEATELDGRKTVSFEYQKPEAPVYVRADVELLRAALSELISNALRFARQRVHVSLAADGDKHSGERVAVVIHDDGPGFSAEFIAQLDPPGLRPRAGQRGSGLSLAGALAVAALHGGALRIEAPAAGSSGGRVKFALPAQTASQDQRASQSART
jgi:signal transduction histidine kinase